MAQSVVRSRLANSLTSRRGAWVSLVISLIVMVMLFGAWGASKAPAGTSAAPDASESTQVSELMTQFAGADRQPALVVAKRADAGELSQSDRDHLADLLPVLDAHSADPSSGPLVSEDGQAAILITPITVGESNTVTAETIDAIRATLTENTPAGLTLYVTGGPAFGADVASAFNGADFTLLLVTIVIVAVLLIVTYRSPILWLIPLAVVAIADGLAGRAAAFAGSTLDLQFDSGIISVLVFGAGTNYALLLISRYREELFLTDNHRTALAAAWRKSIAAIIASNVTVVLALLTLVFAVIPGTQGLGVTSAIGLVIALLAVLFVLPPLLAICGRRIFWPFIPRPGATRASGGMWRSIATSVVTRPVISGLAGAALLLTLASGLLGTSIGLTQTEKFRVQSESAQGLEALSGHFAPGEAQPIYIIANAAMADEVVSAALDVEGVVRARAIETSTDDALTKVMVTSAYDPSSAESLQQVDVLRGVVHDLDGANALVGGAVATDVDARVGNQRDLLLVAPLVLGISFVVLLLLLRSLVAPALLMLVNVASALAAIGAGSWLSRVLFDQPALDLQVPLLSFLFLVALGIDYTIFLVHRARTDAMAHGTREGMIHAVAHTGSVITSAGIVLAGVFAALGVLPLVTLGQLGLIVGLGVIVDTLVVRTIIVPAIFSLLGDRVWWPSTIPRREAELTHDDRRVSAHAA